VTLAIVAVSMGLMSGGHCLGMCGPLVLALPVNTTSTAASVLYRITYNLGRITTYVALGAIAGITGVALGVNIQAQVSVIAGIALITVGIVQLMPWAHASLFAGIHRKLSAFARPLATTSPVFRFLVLGMINGLLPCGMVALALAASIGTASVKGSMSYMFFFGLGTFPVMLAASLFGMYISQRVRRWLAVAGPLYGIALGLLLIMRPVLNTGHLHHHH
jgi:uncharacterized protein